MFDFAAGKPTQSSSTLSLMNVALGKNPELHDSQAHFVPHLFNLSSFIKTQTFPWPVQNISQTVQDMDNVREVLIKLPQVLAPKAPQRTLYICQVHAQKSITAKKKKIKTQEGKNKKHLLLYLQ